MKTMKVKKPIKLTKEAPIIPILERFVAGFNSLEKAVVGRSEAITAIKLAMLTSSHVMLDGLQGLGKSKLASNAFKIVTGDDDEEPVVFRKLLMAGTNSDEVFGPMISEKYRKEAIWEHNTQGMLPSAHFAFLDEVYRASTGLLPSMLGILNEREFMNGGKLVHCPLLTCIGTTNFITENEELAAFHDRWLFSVKVEPLSDAQLRRAMFDSFLDNNEFVPEATITLKELKLLHGAIRNLEVTESVFDGFEAVLSEIRRLHPSLYISDRRMCQLLRVVQAATLLDAVNEGDVPSNCSIVGLLSLANCVSPVPSSKISDDYLGIAERVSSTIIAEEKEIPKAEDFLEQAETLFKQFDESLSPKKKRALTDQVLELLASMEAESFSSPKAVEVFEKASSRVNSLRLSLASPQTDDENTIMNQDNNAEKEVIFDETPPKAKKPNKVTLESLFS